MRSIQSGRNWYGLGTCVLAAALATAIVTESAPQSKPKTPVSGVGVTKVVKVEPSAKTYPRCSRRHPGRARRLESLAKQGDSRMGWSAAGHAVYYGIERYGLQDLVSDTSFARAHKDMYEFLKWKTGSASLLAAQWLSAGYQHYDAYAGEAAVSLLGTNLPGPEKKLMLPKALTAWIMEQTDSAAKATNEQICGALFGGVEGGTSPTTSGPGGSTQPGEADLASTLGGVACVAVVELARQATQRVYARLGLEAGVFKNWKGIGDTEVLAQENFRRNPPASTATASTSSPSSGKESELPTSIRLPGRLPPRR
jgi:hypothetical protein